MNSPAIKAAPPALLQTPGPVASCNGACVRCHNPGVARRLEDRQLLAMEAAFLATGGLVTVDQVARLRQRAQQPRLKLTRWISTRQVIRIEWHANDWLPLFQFNPSSMTLRGEVSVVIQELSDVFDDWDLCLWFASPNTWLRGATPVDALAGEAIDVLDAARADRFIARG